MDIAQFSHSGVCLGENSDIFFCFLLAALCKIYQRVSLRLRQNRQNIGADANPGFSFHNSVILEACEQTFQAAVAPGF